VRLKWHADILNGYAFKSEQFTDHGIPIVRQSNLKSGKIIHDGKCYPSELVPSKFRLKVRDICIGLSGSIENFGIVDQRVLPCALNQRVGALRAKKRKASSRYIEYLVQSVIFKHHVASNLPSTTIVNIDAGLVGNAPFPEVDLTTQRQIADFLDRETARIDLLIEKREKFASLVAEARDSLLARMICGEGPETLDTTRNDWTDARPENWKSERAKVHFRERIEKSVDGSEELLTVSHITGVTTRAEKDVNMFLAESNEGYKIVHPSDIVINTMWGWMGAMGASSHHGIISPSYGVYRPTSDAFEREYLDLMLRSKPFIAEVTRRSKGIHSSRLRIYPDAFLDMRLPVPPRDEQVAILAELRRRTERENALLAKNEQASALLKEYRSALITAAVTGQVNVDTYTRRGRVDRQLDAIREEMET
tara:strand:- start:18897 stop:20162 length:1266 start_codon:yes stop_codon:yes gene_type:complete